VWRIHKNQEVFFQDVAATVFSRKTI